MLTSAKILTASAIVFMSSSALATTPVGSSNALKDEYSGLEQREYVPFVDTDAAGAARNASAGSSGYIVQGFQGVSQYDVASYARNFIPPDSMGAVGTTQYTEFVNGGFAVFNKSDGSVAKATSDVAFWNAAGQTSANGDSRVLFDKAASRWIALSFGASVSDIQIAVSDTANAAGAWHSTIFTGFAGGTADYPTLAMDNHAIYIGTNNFNGDGSFGGTTLNLIPLASLVSASAPTTAGLKQFITPYDSVNGGADGGYAIQGVNSTSGDPTGHVLAVSLFYPNTIRYDVTNAGTAAAQKVNAQYIGINGYDPNGAARQPNVGGASDINLNPPTSGSYFASNDRVIDTLDDRYSSSVFEQNGLIYAVHTVTPTGTEFTAVRYQVIDATTNQILDEGDISDGSHDFYQGSLSVNEKGQVVIAYNRSGSNPADGNISLLARVFSTVNGKLVQRGAEALLKVSVVDDYHNGSIDGFVASGRQRWGDYSSVTLDPSNSENFWVIGEYAREYNDTAGGHPGGTGGSRWSTWITELNVASAVPEPSSWIMMIAGFGVVGAACRRKRMGVFAAATA